MMTIIETARVLLAQDKKGVTAIEYALIAGVLVAGIGVAFTALTGSLNTFFSGISFSS